MNVNEVKFDVGPLDHAKAEAKPLEIKSYSLGMKCRFCSQIFIDIVEKESDAHIQYRTWMSNMPIQGLILYSLERNYHQ